MKEVSDQSRLGGAQFSSARTMHFRDAATDERSKGGRTQKGLTCDVAAEATQRSPGCRSRLTLRKAGRPSRR